jgi:ATP-dependent DNA helicase DinG
VPPSSRRTAADGRLPSREDARHLPKIVSFARTSATGDRGELADVPENASIWPLVTSTRDNCLGAECAFHADCFVLKARKAALEADIVVVNHHLFFADVMLRDEGLAELLPACNTLILDEAHQLPDTATLFFGEELTSGQLAELARDAEVAARTGAREVAELPEASAGVAPATRKLRLALGDMPTKITQRVAAEKEGFGAALDELTASLDRLATELGLFAERSEDIANCAERARAAAAQLARWRSGLAGNPDESDTGGTAWIRWVDVTQTGWQLHASPLSVAEVFGKRVSDSGRGWIFTSATLAVGKDFSLYQRELGLADAATGCWESPFNYPAQGLLYVPRDLPQPNSREHTEAVVAASLPVLRASGGRAFLLFTTLRALNIARELLAEALKREGLDWPLLVQGEGSRSELLARFRELGKCDPAGQRKLPRGRRRPRCGAVRRHPRQAAVRAARRSAALSTSRALARRGRQSVLRLSAAAGGHRTEAGSRAPDTHGDRSRRADDLRSPPHRQAVWQAHLAKPPADAAHAGVEGRRGVLPRRRLAAPGRGCTTARSAATRISTRASAAFRRDRRCRGMSA